MLEDSIATISIPNVKVKDSASYTVIFSPPSNGIGVSRPPLRADFYYVIRSIAHLLGLRYSNSNRGSKSVDKCKEPCHINVFTCDYDMLSSPDRCVEWLGRMLDCPPVKDRCPQRGTDPCRILSKRIVGTNR